MLIIARKTSNLSYAYIFNCTKYSIFFFLFWFTRIDIISK